MNTGPNAWDILQGLAATFYGGITGEITLMQGYALSAGWLWNTSGETGFYATGTQTNGFNLGLGGTAGYQFGTVGDDFRGSGYTATVSTPDGGVSVNSSPAGEFSGAAFESPARFFGLSAGPTNTCVWTNRESGC
jgi:hypothetical protein